jgi:quercetin dioxygenase-like cupin family protein
VRNFRTASLATGAITIVGASVFLANAVQATPPVNWSGTPLVVANLNEIARTNDERIKFQTKDSTDTQVVRLEWAANGSSGWHHHPGMVLVQVASGSIDVTRVENGRCETKTYGAGSSFVEGDSAHVGVSSNGAVAYATAIVVDGQPGRINDDAPPCASGPAIREVK